MPEQTSGNRWKARIRRFLPRSIRPHRILRGPLRGNVIVTSWHDYPGAILGRTESGLLEWFAHNVGVGETWLDVGAHYGYTSIALSRFVGSSGRVFAFEPMLSTAGHLAQTRALNHLTQITILPFGLGATDIVALSALPTVRGMADSTADMGTHWSEPVLMARLDAIWSGLAGAQPAVHGVKIDVQGMELAALRGMANLLGQYHPKLVIEVHKGISRDDLFALLEAAGYSSRATAIDGGSSLDLRDDCSYVFLPRSDARSDAHRA